MALSTSGPSWQVDISGLSQLILNVGSHGLKQLALAGIDIHSIGCMLMIAEFTPACPEFRNRITKTRDAQRSERLWMYKIVELGTATNFLADQLLKTRAGENVLALLAATVPVMDEQTCTATLTALFEGANVSLDNTPGIKQLCAIRDGVVALTRKTGVGEKVLKYHQFLWSLLRVNGPPPGEDPYTAIPLAKDIASIIRLLYKVVSSSESHVLIVRGMRGAAWVAAYACDVLGLRVCALDKDKSSVPMTGHYEDVQVVLDLAGTSEGCDLYLSGDVQDHVEFISTTKIVRRGWSFDCSAINFLEYNHPHITTSKDFARISAFTAIETLNRVSSETAVYSNAPMMQDFEIVPGLVTYAESELRHLQERCIEILNILGFRPGMIKSYRFRESRGCPNYMCTGHETDPPILNAEIKEESLSDVEDYHIFLKTRPNHGHERSEGSSFNAEKGLARLKNYIADPSKHGFEAADTKDSTTYNDDFLHWHPGLQSELVSTIHHAATFASQLAFSDWHKSLRQMSVRFLRFGTTEFSRTGFTSSPENFLMHVLMLSVDSVERSILENKLWDAHWISYDVDGVLVHRNTARHHAIHDLHAMFLGFTPGRIHFEGNQCSTIRVDRSGIYYPPSTRSSKIDINLMHKQNSGEVTMRTLITNVKDALLVRFEVTNPSSLECVADASRTAQTLPKALVTLACPRDSTCSSSPMVQDFRTEFRSGLLYSHTKYRRTVNVIIQASNANPLAQWLATHCISKLAFGLMVVLRDCCVACAMNRIYNAIWMHFRGRELPEQGVDVCIVPADVSENTSVQGFLNAATRETN